MKMAKLSISAAVLAAALPATAVVADDWSGSYVGFSGGYSWGELDAGALVTDGKKIGKGLLAVAASFGELSPTGPEISAYMGHRFNSGGFIYGGEIGVMAGEASDDAGGNNDFEFGYSVFARAIAGQVVGDYMYYGALGLTSTAISSNRRGNDQDNAFGVSFGAGMERMLSEHWSLRTELSHTVYHNYEFLLNENSNTRMEMPMSRTNIQIGINYNF